MNRIMRWPFVAALLIAALYAAPALAIWDDGGVRVTFEPSDQLSSVMCSDGEGGMIVAWADNSSGTYDVYAQRVNAAGWYMWGSDGIVVSSAANNQASPRITPDGSGGAYIAWTDQRGTDIDIYAQHVSADGVLLWPYNGLAVCTASNDQYYLAITTLEDGGLALAWIDRRIDGSTDVFAQRITDSGFPYWMPDGVPVSTVSEYLIYFFPDIVSDGSNGVIVAWLDARGDDWDVYAQKLNNYGVAQWTDQGEPVCTAANDQSFLRMTGDGAGGAIICWNETGGGDGVFAQRISAGGTVQWAARGVPICEELSTMAYPDIDSDGAGGAYIAWKTMAEDMDGDIFAQRIAGDGSLYWQDNGLPVCVYVGAQQEPLVLGDGSGGAYVAWTDLRYQADIYAQRLDALGAPLWHEDGLAVCTEASAQYLRGLAADDKGGILVSWADYRDEAQYEIYGQQLDAEGRNGYFPPYIDHVEDVPGDEGGYVTLAWNASCYDYLTSEITTYSIWRATTPAAAAALLESGAKIIDVPSRIFADEREAARPAECAPGDVHVLLRAATGDHYWEYIMQQAASLLTHYSKTVPTTFDSSAVTGQSRHCFQVIAHTSDEWVYFTSPPDSGYSVDNLAPGMPLAVTGCGSTAPEGLGLSWEDNPETDLAGYRVYRGIHEAFVPDEGSLLGMTGEASFFDGEWRDNLGYWYKVTAVDIHGNESIYASYYSGMEVTGADIPQADYLGRNFPNPFNPMTTISFGLRAEAHVTLRIYDTSGRMVRELVDGRLPAGRHAETWDGKSKEGIKVSSGVYFCRIVAGDFTRTRKLVLLR